MIKLEKYSEVHLRFFTESSIEAELVDFFKFRVKGYQFMPAYKAGMWDGYVRLANANTKTLYVGLLNYVIEFAKRYGYELEIDENLYVNNNINTDIVKQFTDTLNLAARGQSITLRDYQIDAIRQALDTNRVTLQSPTASGKSALIYSIIRWHLNANRKILLIVPNTSLVEQMYSDFLDYSSINGFSIDNNMQKLYSGFTKDFTKNVLISTWQSLITIKTKSFFNQFDCVIVDECLHVDTLVDTYLGKTQITDINIGDLVLTLNEDTKVYEYKPVIKVHKNLSIKEKKFKITYEDGTSVIITGNHKQYTNRGWIRTDELVLDDMILSY